MDSLTERMCRAFALAEREAVLLRGFARACLDRLRRECAPLDTAGPLEASRVRCLLLADEAA
jgi:hypothetical protein